MKKEVYFTAGQFARLHQINKRTLHYYDDIGLFSPAYKGDNGYRYYSYLQSPELENILALRELGMSLEELKAYLKHPGPEAFLDTSRRKIQDVDREIRRLTQLKTILQEKQDAVSLCAGIQDGEIALARLPEENLLLTPVQAEGSAPEDMALIMEHLRRAWANSPSKTGCGCYLSLGKARQGQFDLYDGIYSPVSSPVMSSPCKEGLYLRPAGTYLQGYCVGSWDKIPALYGKLLAFADSRGLELTGRCYEIGLNEFAISREDQYVTQITIRCRPDSQGRAQP